MSSDSESDAPEAITLSQSATSARGRERAIQTFRAAEQHKTKERNRKRDQRLKEQAKGKKADAVPGKGKGKRVAADEDLDEQDDGQDEETQRLLARMARAMDEAEGESDSELDSGEEDEFAGLGDLNDGSEDDGDGIGEHEPGSEDGHSEDGHSEDVSEDDEPPAPAALQAPRPKDKYLPDHLFEAALSKNTTSKTKADPSPTMPSKKRKRAQNKSKDIVLGSRTIRTLPPVHTTAVTPAPGTTTRPARVKRFLSRALNVSGKQKPKAHAWERRAVNIALSKRSGGPPVTGFVRSQ
ncbi:hypothetical protein FA95DRAFT_1602576 [Auriscalpium vulgare]|uniref:Uncharacterized protein n=1 Tax=Auriscalpium vulgare TaxID=40419 RepID=A0ACB8S600_9AGAM|nr:hypothetical protein FA95DRAFT_1602576 [Auriscalpium vulgare]